MQLIDLGWNSFFENNFKEYKNQGYSAMRISRGNRNKLIAYNENGKYSCEITGKFRFENDRKSKFPTVGDWVIVSLVPNEKKAKILAILPRKSLFSRKVTGVITEEQPVAANIDIIFIITGLDLNYNLRRIERYLSLAWESGAQPVLLLNKSDLCPEAEERKREVESIAAGVDVYTLNAYNQKDLDKLNKYIKKEQTLAFLGSSGVGKSTIINSLLGTDYLKTNEVNEFGSRGRHTTSFSELIFLPNGGMVIDTPGMREIQVWGEETAMKQVFEDIDELSANCRFKDCSHEKEPGCAVQEAITNGSLEKKRFDNYLKLKNEFAYIQDRKTMKANAIEKSRWKDISKYTKKIKKGKLK
ncbi:MAG: ribosome small subunit-dependent GTPase A [Candidatus Marinimicrobia bacterium]|nr:ribosome small subunit-dependent GTPase A [Candidatus Neomarinimicrobiota bacterium]